MGNRRRSPRLLRQEKFARSEMEDAVTGMALGEPEIRRQIEALAVGQSIEFKIHNGLEGAGRRALVLKVTRRLFEVDFEVRRG
jgi:hypothetical protein